MARGRDGGGSCGIIAGTRGGRRAELPSRRPAVPPSRRPALPPFRLGFTLIEVLIALVLMAIVSAILFQLVIGSQRISMAQTERGAVQANARAGVLILPTELQELGYITQPGGTSQQSDIRYMGAAFIDFRARRGVGFFCGQFPGDPLDRIRIRVAPVGDGRVWRGLRAPEAGDSLFIFLEDDPAEVNDDRWKRARITGSPTSGACAGEAAGTALNLGLVTDLTAGETAKLRAGAPVAWFERVTYDTYLDAANGLTWLGVRVNGGSREPILGPLAADSGMVLHYYSRSGAEIVDTTDRQSVRSVEIQFNGASSRLVRAGAGFGAALTTDTVRFSTRVALRNNLERVVP